MITRNCLRVFSMTLVFAVVLAHRAVGDEVVFLMDKSFSMGAMDQRSQPRYQKAIARALEDVKFHLAARDRVTVILFDSVISTGRVLESVSDAETFFRGFTPGGDTNIIDALAYAFHEIRDSDHPLIYLYTDGDQTERASMDWDELVSLYNGYNEDVAPNRRIKLFHIKWRDSSKDSSTDDALRQIESVTELASRPRNWAAVDKVYFRPSNFRLEYNVDQGAIEEPVAVYWFTVDMSERLRGKNLKFSVHAEIDATEPIDLIVSPSRFDCSRDLDIDGSILMSFRCNGISNLAPDQDHPIRLTFDLENQEIDAKSIRFSPPLCQVAGTLRLVRTPSFSVVEPGNGVLSIESDLVQEVEDFPIRLVWNEAAEGGELKLEYRFPIALQAELLEVTPRGIEPLDPPERILLDESGSRDFVLSLNRAVRGSLDGEIGFEGFGKSEAVLVEYRLPVATVAVLPLSFETQLFLPEATSVGAVDGDGDRDSVLDGDDPFQFTTVNSAETTPANPAGGTPVAGAVSSSPIQLRFMAAEGATVLAPRIRFGAMFLDHPDVSVNVVPGSVVLTADLVEAGVDVQIVVANHQELSIGNDVPIELTFEVEEGDDPAFVASALRFNPVDQRLVGVVHVVPDPTFTLTRNGGLDLDFSEIVPGEVSIERFHLAWTSSAVGETIEIDVSTADAISVELFEERAGARIPIRSGGFLLDDGGQADLVGLFRAVKPGAASGALKLSAFGKTLSVSMTGSVTFGHVNVLVDRGVYSLRSIVGQWTSADVGLTISPQNLSACGQAVTLKVTSDDGVLLEVTDEDGEIVNGTDVTLPLNLGEEVRYKIRAKNAYSQLGRRTDRPLNFIHIAAVGDASLTFGEEQRSRLKIPIGFALLRPEVDLRLAGQKAEHVVLGFLGDATSIEDGWAVSFELDVLNVGDEVRAEFEKEFLQVETSASSSAVGVEAFFVATGLPAASVHEFITDPRIGFRGVSPGIKLKLEESLGSISVYSPVDHVRITPRNLNLTYTRKGLLAACAGLFFCLAAVGGVVVARKRGSVKLHGYLVVERAPADVEVDVTCFDLGALSTTTCLLGLTPEGEIDLGPTASGAYVRIVAEKSGASIEAVSSSEVFLNEMPLAERSTLFDLSILDIADFRFRFQTEMNEEFETSESTDEETGLGLIDPDSFDRDELVLEDDDEDHLGAGFDEQVVLEETSDVEDYRRVDRDGTPHIVRENSDSNLSETIVLEEEE